MINFLLSITYLATPFFPRPFRVVFFFKMVKKVFNENTKLLKIYLSLKGE